MDKTGFGAFLHRRRTALRPEDVGLSPGQRRRTSGLRREEVAALSHMSPDYYARLERGTGPQPSEQMIASIAHGLHLSIEERNHLFRLAGHHPPDRGPSSDHISPGLLRILDRLEDTPAEITTELGETLRQTRLGVALTGDTTHFTGSNRSIGYRWFTDPSSRKLYAEEDHPFLSRLWVSGLRDVAGRRGPHSRAAHLADELLQHSAEFTTLWDRQEVGLRPKSTKRFVHPELGSLDLACQTLIDPEQAHFLLVYTAAPETESFDKLNLLSVIGSLAVS